MSQKYLVLDSKTGEKTNFVVEQLAGTKCCSTLCKFSEKSFQPSPLGLCKDCQNHGHTLCILNGKCGCRKSDFNTIISHFVESCPPREGPLVESLFMAANYGNGPEMQICRELILVELKDQGHSRMQETVFKVRAICKWDKVLLRDRGFPEDVIDTLHNKTKKVTFAQRYPAYVEALRNNDDIKLGPIEEGAMARIVCVAFNFKENTLRDLTTGRLGGYIHGPALWCWTRGVKRMGSSSPPLCG
jgi:hypothetical protein